jgi:hypothetical protein
MKLRISEAGIVIRWRKRRGIKSNTRQEEEARERRKRNRKENANEETDSRQL